jgi:hypothetical protein
VVWSSTLDSFEGIIELAKGKLMTLFLDYDGNISCIVNNPDKVFMSNEVKATNILNPKMPIDPYNTYCFLTPHHRMRDVLREGTRVIPTSIVIPIHNEGFMKLE